MSTNTLYPVFLKLDKITTLIVGGGKVALEKLYFMLKSSPEARVRLVASSYSSEVVALVKESPNVELIQDNYHGKYLTGIGLIIAATNDPRVNRQIMKEAKKRHILVNVADTPEMCQFYLGAIVTKGDLKLAISTNGKSPVMAKRLRSFFENVLPDNIQLLLDNMESIRQKVGADLKSKTVLLNELTSSFLKP